MKDNIVIVGGGIAGMEAARQLLLLGYKPILVEKSDHLGGHVADWHCLFPDLTPAKEVIANLASQIKEANIFLETEVSFINKMKMGYNVMFSNGVNVICKAILLATGFDLFDASKKEDKHKADRNHKRDRHLVQNVDQVPCAEEILLGDRTDRCHDNQKNDRHHTSDAVLFRIIFDLLGKLFTDR